jgi:hypothetical protein
MVLESESSDLWRIQHPRVVHPFVHEYFLVLHCCEAAIVRYAAVFAAWRHYCLCALVLSARMLLLPFLCVLQLFLET